MCMYGFAPFFFDECSRRELKASVLNPSHVRARSVGGEVPVCAGVRFTQDRVTGARVR